MYRAIIAVIIIIVILLLILPYGREAMTKIRRTVGTANEANEIQVAAGVVNSVPIMDYTYTYWDGDKITSCDECPNAIVCPHCPQFSTSERMGAEHFDLAAGTHGYESSVVDINADYTDSREYMGACRGPMRTRKHNTNCISRQDAKLMELNADDKFNNEIRALGRTDRHSCSPDNGCPPNNTREITGFLYGNTRYPPTKNGCIFFNTAGYEYEEPCKYSTRVTQQMNMDLAPNTDEERGEVYC